MNEHVTRDKVWVGIDGDCIVWWNEEVDEWFGYFIHDGTWTDSYWDIDLMPALRENFSILPTGPCAECDTPIRFDYLCPDCRAT